MNQTVKVRIAVAVDPSGKWFAAGSSDLAGHDAAAVAYVSGSKPWAAVHWLNYELPIPTVPVLTPEVSEAAQ